MLVWSRYLTRRWKQWNIVQIDRWYIRGYSAAPGIRSLLSTRAKLCSNYSRIRYIFVEDEIRVDAAVNLKGDT